MGILYHQQLHYNRVWKAIANCRCHVNAQQDLQQVRSFYPKTLDDSFQLKVRHRMNFRRCLMLSRPVKQFEKLIVTMENSIHIIITYAVLILVS